VTITIVRDIVNIVQMLGVLVCIYMNVRGLRKHPKSLLTLFFALSLMCLLLSDLYWMVHMWMGRGVYAAFSVVDVGTYGFYLLMAAAVGAVFPEKIREDRLAMAVAAVFAAANAALWILWSGYVFTNILGGVCFVFLLCSEAHGLKCSGALSRWEWAVLAAAGCAVIAVNTALLRLSGGGYYAMNLVNTAVLFAVLAFFYIRTIQALRRKDADKALALAFSGMTWNFIAIYLSEEPYYTIVDFFILFSIVLVFIGVRRKAAER